MAQANSAKGSISPEKLERRRSQLRKRKYSFIELVMNVKKKIYKEKLAKRRKKREEKRLRLQKSEGDGFRQGAD